jgi:opacity protein-like surface antigen
MVWNQWVLNCTVAQAADASTLEFMSCGSVRLPCALAFSMSGPYNFQINLAVIRMPMFAGRLCLVLVVAVLALGGRTAHAQSNPMTYWTPGWLGFGGNLDAGQGANPQPGLAGFDGGAGGLSSRYNFSNGWFVGNERGGMGSGLSGINQAGAFGSLQTEGVQFGYTFKNSAVSVYGGFDNLKYNPGIGSAFSPFDSTPSTAGYGAHAGVEFKPTSNLSLSLGVGYTQSGRRDTDSKSPSLSNASQTDLVRSWR